MPIKPRKRLFISLLLALEIAIAAGLFLLWYIPSQGYANFGRNLSVFMAWITGAVVLVFTLGIVFLVVIILRGKEVRGARGLRGILIRYLIPVIIPIGRLFGIPKDDIRRSFIEINNELVKSSSFRVPPKRVLVLLPHCVQLDVCPYRLTVDVKNCRQCGKCDFSELTAIADRLGVEITVATGGTLARRVVMESNPEIIVGVACERDLSAGIVDTYPIPVIGVLLDRPEGPCVNTRVSVDRVSEALQNFLPEGFFDGEQKTDTAPAP
ncbi:MAG: DUF116 domain-containing protein [bacterium]|nr:DUF116 domain-containing protein [bacterium]MDT8396577.1 DUF116 domain-containing protein [bacterium]